MPCPVQAVTDLQIPARGTGNPFPTDILQRRKDSPLTFVSGGSFGFPVRASPWQSARPVLNILAVVDVPLDAVDDHFQCDEVLASLENNQIGVLLARLDELLMHGLDRRQIL